MPAPTGRASLPTEFFDRTSTIVLRQPLPQYLYARMLFGAAAQAELRRLGPDAFAMEGAPQRGVSSQGAPYPDISGMTDILADEIRADAIMVTDELAEGKVGHTIRLNRPIFTGGGYTEASRIIAAGQSISLSPIGMTDEQVSITIKRVVGPFAAGGTTPQPYAIDSVDSEHSVHSLADRVGVALQQDRNAYVDGVFAKYFDSGSHVLYPGDSSNALEDGGDAAAIVTQGDRPLDMETLLRMESVLHDAKIPRFRNGRYLFLATPKELSQLKSDPQFRGQAAFLPGANLLNDSGAATTLVVNNAIEVYASQTNIIDTTTVAGVSIHHGVMFGPGLVGYAPTNKGVQVKRANEDNYGETSMVIWIAYEGHTITDNRFGISVHTS